MPTVGQSSLPVKPKCQPGRPLLRTPVVERMIIRTCVRSAIVSGQMPSDIELAQKCDLGERTVRAIRLEAGLVRWDVSAWVKARAQNLPAAPAGEILCWTTFAGLWLLVPLLMRSTLLRAAGVLRWTTRTSVAAGQWVLTVVLWSVLNFRRFWHLNDFRHKADLGLALFTGRLRLLADSTVWRLVHCLTTDSATASTNRRSSTARPRAAKSRTRRWRRTRSWRRLRGVASRGREKTASRRSAPETGSLGTAPPGRGAAEATV